MEQEKPKKSSGCGTLIVAAIIVFFVYQFISGLGPEDNDEPDTVTTTPSATVVTEPVVPSPEEREETTTEPTEGVEEGTIPSDKSTDEPQQPEEKAVEPPPKGDSIQFTEVVEEAPQSAKIITRNYEWEFGGSDWNWEISIPEAIYDYFKGIPRLPTRNYSVYVTHPWDDPYIDRLVENIREAASKKGYDEYQTIEFAIAFVQSMPYTVDSVTSPFDEYPRYPTETLVDGGGDCEDTAILLASLLDSMGFGVVLLRFPDHMAVGIKGGDNVYGTYWTLGKDKYFYIETTGVGWQIGRLPDEYAGMSASIYRMEPVPIITHEWDLEGEEYYLVLKVNVNNLGTATATDVYVFACFDAGDGTGWSIRQSDTFSLEPGHQVTATLGLLPPPSGVHTRMMVRIVMRGYTVDESYSVWFDT